MTAEQSSADLRSQSAEKRARKTSAKLAKLAGGGTSARSVEMMKTVRLYGPPGLVDKVGSGEMRLSAAYQETRLYVIEARRLGLDVDPACRIGGHVQPRDTEPCSHCKGTGRAPMSERSERTEQANAQHAADPLPSKRSERKAALVCLGCDTPLIGKRRDAEFCGNRCRLRLAKRRQRAAAKTRANTTEETP